MNNQGMGNFELPQPKFVGGTNKQILIVYSPKTISQQVVRPLVYNFTPAAVDGINNSIDVMQNSGKMGIVTDAMSNAILPDSTGVAINTTALSERWTFTVIITNGGDMAGGLYIPQSNTYACGYFTDVPFTDAVLNANVDLTPNEANPNAMMVVTTTSCHSGNLMTGMHGMNNVRQSVSHVDVISPSANSLYGQDMCIITPKTAAESEVNKTTRLSNDNVVDVSGVVDSNTINSVKNQGTNVTVSNTLKLPTTHMSNILEAFDTGVVLSEDDTMMSFGISGGNQPFTNTFEDHTKGALMGPEEVQLSGGQIDPATPVSVTEFVRAHPAVTLQCVYYTPKHMDICDQDIIHVETQMSSLATHVVTTLCVENEVSELNLYYSSYDANAGLASISKGVYNLTVLNTINPNGQPAIIGKKLCRLLEHHLFDILQRANGEFEIQIVFTMGGDCFIDLRYLDFSHIDGYTETPTMYGGSISTALGTKDNLNNNAVQFTSLMDVVSGMPKQNNTLPDMNTIMSGSNINQGGNNAGVNIGASAPVY